MTHPYSDAPNYRRWRRAVAALAPRDVDPVVSFPMSIAPTDKVMTAGSCFAQHISRRLQSSGFNFLVTETCHPLIDPQVATNFNYGVFTARYGNIYTSRQLLQLFRRAFGDFQPVEDVWAAGPLFVDPFRPTIQQGAFTSLDEYRADRSQHFAAVRRALEEVDVFVFTLGLTEAWASRCDGAVYPLCPGVEGGVFDPDKHVFINLTVDEVVADMREAIGRLRGLNPRTRVILTVSPVPLMATAMDRHVLVSTTYSKSVLRVAAEILTGLPDVFYFPSYEIITGNFSRGAYYAEDLRSVREEGVQHVMDLFFRHVTEGGPTVREPGSETSDSFISRMENVVELLCDEELLDRPAANAAS